MLLVDKKGLRITAYLSIFHKNFVKIIIIIIIYCFNASVYFFGVSTFFKYFILLIKKFFFFFLIVSITIKINFLYYKFIVLNKSE